MNNQYRIFVSQTFELVRSFGIVLHETAKVENQGLRLNNQGIVINESDPATWKYYQNIMGVRHESEPPIMIRSSTTGREMEFCKCSLRSDALTRKAYQYGTRFYHDLLNRYPHRAPFIRGVLHAPDYNPTDDAIIESSPSRILDFIRPITQLKSGTLVYCDESLIEPNEYHLLQDTQDWLYRYLDRWTVMNYQLAENLYLADVYHRLYLNLVALIINLRWLRCKTNEVNSYHVRLYLASQGFLNVYLNSLTLEQSLFLYRNILYIQTNAGKRDVMLWLVDNIMKKRGLPVAQYVIKHDLEGLMYDPISDDYPRRRPLPYFQRKIIDGTDDVFTTNSHSVDYITKMMEPNANGNPDYFKYHSDDLLNKLTDSKTNTLQTKLLESRVDDLSDATQYQIWFMSLNHWGFWALNGQYSAQIEIEIPSTRKTMTLSAKEAFFLFVRCIISVGAGSSTDPDSGAPLTNDAIFVSDDYGAPADPYFIAERVINPTAPVLREVRNCLIPNRLSDAQISAAFRDHPEVGSIRDADTFYQKVNLVYDYSWKQLRLKTHFGSAYQASAFEMASSRSWGDRLIPMTGYQAWVAENKSSLAGMTDTDRLHLRATLMNEFTQVSKNKSASVKLVQKAMIEVMKRLLSYTVQFVSDVTSSGIQATHMRLPRINALHDVSDLHVPIMAYRLDIINDRCSIDYKFTGVRPRTHDLVADHTTIQVKMSSRQSFRPSIGGNGSYPGEYGDRGVTDPGPKIKCLAFQRSVVRER